MDAPTEWAEWEKSEGEDNMRALLAFVDEFQVDLSELQRELQCDDQRADLAIATEASVQVPAALAASTKSSHANSSTARRARQREEMIYLRSRVRELELQLKALESTHRQQLAADAAAAASDACDRQLGTRIWEQVAHRQFEERHRAEKENARLRQVLEQQVKLAKSLERLLKKSEKVQLFASPCANVGSYLPNPLESAGMEAEMIATLPSLYAQVDTMFVDPRYKAVDSQFNDAQVHFHENDVISFDFKTARVVPFDVEMTSQAQWELLHKPSFDADHVDTPTEDILIKTFLGAFDSQQRTVIIRGKLIVRRYIEPDRVVVVSAGIAEPITFLGSPMQGIFLHQHSWRVIERPQDPRLLASAVPASHVQFHHLVYVEKPDSLTLPTENIKQLADYGVSVLNQRIETDEQSVENMLVQRSLQTEPRAIHVEGDANYVTF